MIFDNNSNMKKVSSIIFCCFTALTAGAQIFAADTTVSGKVTIIKDSRLNELAKKEAAFNEVLALKPRSGKGYRLVVLSTNDRPLAMNVRAQLLQRYPDQKVYMSFQPPYIKLKFGNYVEKPEAENMRKDILKNKIVTGNIYIIPETIEIKPDKNKEPEQ
jgi:hypothetical protein